MNCTRTSYHMPGRTAQNCSRKIPVSSSFIIYSCIVDLAVAVATTATTAARPPARPVRCGLRPAAPLAVGIMGESPPKMYDTLGKPLGVELDHGCAPLTPHPLPSRHLRRCCNALPCAMQLQLHVLSLRAACAGRSVPCARPRFTTMRQQRHHANLSLSYTLRSTFSQEAVPTETAISHPPAVLDGYQSRFLPAAPVAWRQPSQPKRNFAGKRPELERRIARKQRRDLDAVGRLVSTGPEHLMRAMEKDVWRQQNQAAYDKRKADEARDKELFLKNRERKLVAAATLGQAGAKMPAGK
jgi:hypothetical protein